MRVWKAVEPPKDIDPRLFNILKRLNEGASQTQVTIKTIERTINEGVFDHGHLEGLVPVGTDPNDDHTQYPYLFGRTGGQTWIGDPKLTNVGADVGITLRAFDGDPTNIAGPAQLSLLDMNAFLTGDNVYFGTQGAATTECLVVAGGVGFVNTTNYGGMRIVGQSNSIGPLGVEANLQGLTVVTAYIRARASQTGNLTEWQNPSASPMSYIRVTDGAFVGPIVPSVAVGHLLTTVLFDDVTAGAAARGDLIVGQGATPKWQKLAVGAANKFLMSDGTDATWNTKNLTTTAPLTGGGDLGAGLTLAVSTFGTANSGVVPASGGGTANFLRADGAWAAPAGGGGSGVFADNVFQITGSADATKIAMFEVDGLTTATTRTLTVPDVSATLLLTQGTSAGQVIGTTAHTGGTASSLAIEGPVLIGDNIASTAFAAGTGLDVRFNATNAGTGFNFSLGLANLSGAASGTLNIMSVTTAGIPGYTSGSFILKGLAFGPSLTLPSGVTISSLVGVFVDPSFGTTSGGTISAYYGGLFRVRRAVSSGPTVTDVVGVGSSPSNMNVAATSMRAFLALRSTAPGIVTYGAGVTDDAVAFDVDSTFGAAAQFTTWSGLRIPTIAGPGTIWGLNITGTMNNRIAGHLRIGDTTAPTQALEVVGIIQAHNSAATRYRGDFSPTGTDLVIYAYDDTGAVPMPVSFGANRVATINEAGTAVFGIAGQNQTLTVGQGTTGTDTAKLRVRSGNSGTTSPQFYLNRNGTDVLSLIYDGDSYLEYTGLLNFHAGIGGSTVVQFNLTGGIGVGGVSGSQYSILTRGTRAAIGTVAAGIRGIETLQAAANSDTIVGFMADHTYDPNSKTGVKGIALWIPDVFQGGTGTLAEKWGLYSTNSNVHSSVLGMFKFGSNVVPQAFVDIGPSSTSRPPIKMDPTGVLLTSPTQGTHEYDGTNFYMSPTAVRQKIALMPAVRALASFRA